MFVADGKLHFITKHRQPYRIADWDAGAKLYRLDTRHTDRDNVLTLVGRREDVTVVTEPTCRRTASVSRVATYIALWIFDKPADGGDWFSGKAWKLDLDLAGLAIAWETPTTLILVNENRDVMRASVEDFVAQP